MSSIQSLGYYYQDWQESHVTDAKTLGQYKNGPNIAGTFFTWKLLIWTWSMIWYTARINARILCAINNDMSLRTKKTVSFT